MARASTKSRGSAVETCSTTKPGRLKGSKGVNIQEEIPHTKKIGSVYPSNILGGQSSSHVARNLRKNHSYTVKKTDGDSVRFYFLCEDCQKKVERIGGEMPNQGGTVIV